MPGCVSRYSIVLFAYSSNCDSCDPVSVSTISPPAGGPDESSRTDSLPRL